MSADEPDPYAVLGLARNATAAEIRAAYRKLVRRYHPDHHRGNPLEGLAGERMAEINRAYQVLSNPARRAAFDQGRPFAPGAPAARGGAGLERGVIPPRLRRLMRWGLLLLMLPVLVRTGAGLVRGAVSLARAAFGGLGAMRGTPLLAALALLAATVLVVALVRRSRKGRPPR